MTEPILEVCCGDVDSVRAAVEGGAYRVELCSGLAEGGFTPSVALINAAMCYGAQIKINVLIRPRGGDFLYSDEEKKIMLHDARTAADAGVNGVVCGALMPDGSIDVEFCRKLAASCPGVEITFHRAFDLCSDPLKALDDIINAGFHRVLTSGQAQTALEGVSVLKQLTEHASGRLAILAGGGVNPSNAAEIIRLGGVRELHASARASVGSRMEYRRPGVSMGVPGADEYSRLTTSPELVRQIVHAIKSDI